MPAPTQDDTNDFLATRARAASGDDSWMRSLAAGGSEPAGGGATGAQPAPGATAPAASSPAGPGPEKPAAAAQASDPYADDPSQPFGLRFQNWAQRYSRDVQARNADLQKPLPSAGEAFTGDVSAAWDELKSSFQKTLPDPKYADETLWEKMGSTFKSELATGKMAIDAVKLALSPITGAVDAASTAGAKGLHSVMPAIPEKAYKTFLDDAAAILSKKNPDAAAAAGEAEGAAAGGGSGGAAGGAEGQAGASAAAKPKPAFTVAGQENAGSSAVKVTPELRQQAADFFAGGTENPVNVHIDMLANEASRNELVSQVAKLIPKDGVKSVDATRMAAYSLGLTPEEVIAKIRPQFPGDEIFDAAGMVVNSAGKALWDAARKAQESGDPADFEEATRAFGLFNKYVGEFRGAKTDWGRAGRIQQEIQSSFDPFVQHIQNAIADVGPENVEEIIKKAASFDDPAKVSPFVSNMQWMASRKGVMYAWYNALLSNPATIVKKLASDASLAVWNVATRGTAETLGRIGINSGTVAPGETAALMHGYLGSLRDGLRAAKIALKSGQSQWHGEAQSLFDGRLLDRAAKMANGAPEMLEAEKPTSAAVEYLRAMLPTSWIGAADDFAKVTTYRAELHALAWREATARLEQRAAAAANGADVGNAPEQSLSELVQSLVNNPTQAMHEQAVQSALRNTLQEPLEGLAQTIQEGVDKVNIPIGKTGAVIPFGRMIMPFTKISANVMRVAYRNSPLPLITPSANFRAMMAEGGATRDLALAQVGLGTAASLLLAGFVVSGRLTGRGPGSPELARQRRDAGIPPYSIKIGDTWYGINKIEPLAQTAGAIADTMELMRYAHDDDNAALATSLVLGIGNAMLSKQYMSGFSDFLDALHGDERTGQKWVDNLVTSFAVPAGVAGVERLTDQWYRAHYGLLDTIASRTPGWAENLPPSQNRWGEPLQRAEHFPDIGGLSRMLSPIEEGPDAKDVAPIDKWLWNNRDAFPDADQGKLGLNSPGQTLSYDGVLLQLTPQQIYRRKELAGNGLKDPATGLGAKDALNALVTGKHPDRDLQEQFDNATPAAKAAIVLRIWSSYRTAADQQLIGESKQLQESLRVNATAQAEKLGANVQQPTIGGGQ